jgi:hypothetical protein
MTTETAEIMVHPVLDENRLLSNIGHIEKNILADTTRHILSILPYNLCEAQLRERRARRSAADIRNDVKLERGYSGEI